MKTYFLKTVCLVAAGCCILLSGVRAEDVTPQKHDSSASDSAEVHIDANGVHIDASGPASNDSSADDDDEDDFSHSHDFGRSNHHLHRRDNSVVTLGHDASLGEGERADTVVAIFGSATSAGNVSDSVVSIIGNSHVTGKVGDTVVAVMGNVYVNGRVDNDVVAVLGNVELGPEARVNGDVVVVGGTLTRDSGATIRGSVQSIFSGTLSGFSWLRSWIQRCVLYGRPLAFSADVSWAWGVALGFLALYVVLALVLHDAVDRCVHTLEKHPGQSILAALLTVLLTPVVVILLLVTILGIAVLPFLGLGLLCAALFGKVVVLSAIGRRCTPFLAGNPSLHAAAGVAVGGAIVLVLYTVPVVGFIVFKLLEFLGLGVVLYTLLLAIKAGRQARENGGRSPGGAPGAPGAGGSAGPGGGLGGEPFIGGERLEAVGGIGGGAPGRGEFSARGSGAAAFSGSGPAGPSASATDASAHDTFGGAKAQGGGAPSGASWGGAQEGGAQEGGGTPGGTSAGGAHGGAGYGFTAPPGATSSGANGGAASAASLIAMPRAGFWIRMGALFLDVILVGIVLHQLHDGFNVGLIFLAAYGAVMWKLKAATVGGIICGLKVARLDGREIDWPTAIVRALGCFLSLAVVGLGFIWIGVDDQKQSWHDKIAGTVVVRVPKGASLV